ncbi:hypothetical protein MAR_032161 [Mya arenaria]|uniref:ATP-dependent DNA helicase n=1 Tax=Mya arenaria TaxID=6604 RepID=A0ABY7F7F7_MYAAR|nr:hypothetical protein MAR_032161 [Mya arenaria]
MIKKILQKSNLTHQQKNTLYYLKNSMSVISKQSTSKVTRYHTISTQRDEEMYFHRLLILYLPWRSKEELMFQDSFQKMFHSVKEIISHNIESYETYNDQVEHTLENVDPDAAGPEMWTEIVIQQADDPETKATVLPLLDPEFLANVRHLNIEQINLFDYLYTWATNKILDQVKTEPSYIILTGGAGCGKTFLINTLYEALVRAFRPAEQDPKKPTVLMTASKRKAASNINGMTFCLWVTSKETQI